MIAKFLRNIDTGHEEFVEYLPADFTVPANHEVIERDITQAEYDALLTKPDTQKPFNGLYAHVTSVSPNKFFINTPTKVIVIGGNFDRTTKITVDGIAQETNYVSDTELNAVIEYDEAGEYKLGVCNGALETFVNVNFLAEFNPTGTSGLMCWFDASSKDEMSEANGHINSWATKGGPVVAMTQSSLAEQPQWIPNQFQDLGMLYLSSGDDMQGALSHNYDNLTVFVVWKTNQNNRGTPVSIKPTSQTYGNFMYNNRFGNGDIFMTFDNSSGNNYSSHAVRAGLNDNRIHVIEARCSGNTTRLRVDGAHELEYSENRLSNLTTEYIKIGELTVGGAPYQGYLGEVIAYNRDLSDAEAQQVYEYLLSKWGVVGE